ncbi:MAG: flagellar basal body rod C-terminal domain-containing protein [Candidatus Velthaea sp.]
MDGMQWMASAMHAARSRLEVATHNLANVSSDGYRRFSATLALTPRGLVAAQTQSYEQGAIRHTGRALDFAILGEGAFHTGDERTRNGAFVIDRAGYLADDRGRRVIGTRGAIHMNETSSIGDDGLVHDGMRVVNRIALPAGSRLQRGSLETSNVNAVGETLEILTAQRAFETAQKVLVAIDDARQKSANDVARLK